MLLEESTHRPTVQAAVALRARSPHGRSLASIEHAELQRCHVGCTAHDSAERVYFPDDRSFGDAPNRGIARHLTNALERARYESHASADASSSHGGLSTGVAGTDDDYVKLLLES